MKMFNIKIECLFNKLKNCEYTQLNNYLKCLFSKGRDIWYCVCVYGILKYKDNKG
jgi:hypothetical protein